MRKRLPVDKDRQPFLFWGREALFVQVEPYAVYGELIYVIVCNPDMAIQGDGFVVVVQIVSRSRFVEFVAYERDIVFNETAVYRSHVGHGMEHGVSRGWRPAVTACSFDLSGIRFAKLIGEPCKAGHMQLIVRSGRRGMEEPAAIVVEYVLAVVRAVE